MASKMSGPVNDREQRYHETLHNVPKAMSELMSSYAGVPRDEQIAHITKLRNEAYAQFPYPCMGTFRFLDLDLARHAAYKDHVLAPLCQPAVPGKPEPLFLDCGCCLGQDLRKLVVDGALPHRLWASDIEPRFIELGFELFRDGDKLPRDHFLCPGNVLIDTQDPSEDQLIKLNDNVTILSISAVFHLFDLEDHKRIVNRCLKLLRKDTGAPVLVIGAQVGAQEGKRVPRRPHIGGYRYQHNSESWEALWREVCGQPQWKDHVEALEVKAKNFGRIRNEDPEADEVITLSEPDPTSDARLWQMFEVWVTFRSSS
ncbi:hypothetical protein FHL15_000128 [Xylaria flabelliformis]|uniref:Methyltransferase type 11 domain-containing protein n=1 Tax=Xylaria flabelliformis TaxID=2512241 RepID=A0A553IF31_9PEZI|nr:hypothetical protein FHL15_000128 [Xylaria flabelliformis]